MSLFKRELLSILLRGSLLVGAILVIVFLFNNSNARSAESEIIMSTEEFTNEFFNKDLTDYQLMGKIESLESSEVKYRIIAEGKVLNVTKISMDGGFIDLVIDDGVYLFICIYKLDDAVNEGVVELNKGEDIYISGIYRRSAGGLFIYLDECEINWEDMNNGI